MAHSDSERLDWLEEHSFAFVHDARTGKGFIKLSGAYEGQPGYGLRAAIDKAMLTRGETECQRAKLVDEK
jgi:hypothetical protein